MTRARGLRALAGLAVIAALVLPGAPVRAADVGFGAPDGNATFLEGIEFRVPITTGLELARVELRLRFPDSLGPHIVGIEVPAAGARTLTYTLDVAGGGFIAPNTPIVATWAAYTSLDAEPVLSRPLTVLYADTSHEWRTVKGDLVTVHWYEGDAEFARRALRIGEDAVRDAARLLGVTDPQPIDMFIYADNASFRNALSPGARENVGGRPYENTRTLVALITPAQIDDSWVGIVIPHELVHIVFGTAVRNPYRVPPLWFNEGFTTYQSEGYGPGDRALVAEAAASGGLLPLTALDQFPRYGGFVNLAYAESVSAIDHLVRTDGDAALLALVAAYREGLTDDEAFTKALGRDLEDFQAGWLKELGAEVPQPYGPQPAPPGPLPPGWDGPSRTPDPGSAPGALNPSAKPTTAPGDTGAPGDAAPSGDGAGTWAVLAAILGVVAVVVIGFAVARRRARRAGPA